MQRESVQSIYIKVLWLMTLGLYICIPLKIDFALSLLYYGILALTVGAIVMTVVSDLAQKKMDKQGFVQLVLMAVMAVCVVFSFLFSGEPVTFSIHGMGVLGFFEMVGSIYVIGATDCTKSLKRFIFGTSLVGAFVFIGFSLIPSIAYSDPDLGSLTLGFNNPNETAIYLMSTVCMLVLLFDTLKRWLYKVPLILVIGYLLYLLYCTESRTALIATAIVLLYQIFARQWVLPRWVIPVAVVSPVVFLLVYAFLWQNVPALYDAEILGKEFFSGREQYFVDKLLELRTNWLFGDVGLYYFTNMHNGPLAIVASMGVFGFVAHVVYMVYTLCCYHPHIRTKSQTIALIVILAIFVHSSAEATFIVGGAHYSIIVATFFLLLKDEWQSEQISITEENGEGEADRISEAD